MINAKTSTAGQHAFEQVAADLLTRIQRGEWHKGERVPTIRELGNQYPHSRMTLHKAIRLLIEQGYLEATRGSGTYVRETHIRERVAILVGGSLGPFSRSPFANCCVAHASALIARHGMDASVYDEDMLLPGRVPTQLQDDIARNRVVALLTVQSTYGQFRQQHVEETDQALPHIDIGSLPSDNRVYIDYDAFFSTALTIAREHGSKTTLAIPQGSGLRRETLAAYMTGADVTILAGESRREGGHELWGFELLQRLIDRGELPKAILVAEDNIAKGIAQAALVSKIAVPDDLLIVTLSNRELPLFFPVPIARLTVNVESLVACAGRHLLDRINNPQHHCGSILLPPERPTDLFAGP